jgi:ATP-binding cassette subfamily G (WHITE) protein 1
LIDKFSVETSKGETVQKDAEARVEALVAAFKTNRAAGVAHEVAKGKREWPAGHEQKSDEAVRYKAGWCSQLSTLTSRSFRTLMRDRSILMFRLLQQFFLSLILGMLCFRLADAQSSIQSRKGAIFFILRFTMFINVLGQLMLFPMEMPIFQRESQAHLYRSDTFYLAKNIAELPGQLIFPVIFMSIAYWMIGFADSFDRFAAATGVLVLITSAAASMGYFLSTLSTSVRGVAEAGSNILTTLMLFDGFLINSGSVPPYMRWMGDISIYKWSYEALSIVIWKDFAIGCLPDEVCSFTNGNQVLETLAFSTSDFGLDIGMLFASIFGYRILSYIFVVIHGRRKPKPA